MTGRDGEDKTSWPLGEVLRRARDDKGWSQEDAAQKARFSRTSWQQLESGRRADRKPFRPKADTVINAALAVDVDPREALELAKLDPTRYEPARAGRPTATVTEVRELVMRLTEEQRQAVVNLIRSFTEPAPPSAPATAEAYRHNSVLNARKRVRDVDSD
ncbi:helix-turn-helix transcriptional regulator [Actinokineospora auranticolor]|uniref:Transcriptional regulator with XRE-family HTH domain n=1 Tax=Actinokineospora auranticolor TaxID=155976 RepID=A0A2S6GYY6_9PSEU|nr:helix-turn-helix transcriptional regulator [Actinokineospora auranticolor]PPK70444.1 transcriptional regulator with XRE-family HTH domain [Actinokineospora auranticolor]